MAQRQGKLIIISGPSGVGKGTIRKKLMNDPSLKLWYSVSMTTRNMRPGEVDGKDYYFVSTDEFNKNIEIGNFLEHVEFCGNKYGTPKDKVVEQLNEGHNVILEIDVSGTEMVIENSKELNPITIFIVPPSFKALEARIRGRSTETDDVIKLRLSKAEGEMKIKEKYNYVISNDDVTRATIEIQNIIREEINNQGR